MYKNHEQLQFLIVNELNIKVLMKMQYFPNEVQVIHSFSGSRKKWAYIRCATSLDLEYFQ